MGRENMTRNKQQEKKKKVNPPILQHRIDSSVFRGRVEASVVSHSAVYAVAVAVCAQKYFPNIEDDLIHDVRNNVVEFQCLVSPILYFQLTLQNV